MERRRLCLNVELKGERVKRCCACWGEQSRQRLCNEQRVDSGLAIPPLLVTTRRTSASLCHNRGHHPISTKNGILYPDPRTGTVRPRTIANPSHVAPFLLRRCAVARRVNSARTRSHCGTEATDSRAAACATRHARSGGTSLRGYPAEESARDPESQSPRRIPTPLFYIRYAIFSEVHL